MNNNIQSDNDVFVKQRRDTKNILFLQLRFLCDPVVVFLLCWGKRRYYWGINNRVAARNGDDFMGPERKDERETNKTKVENIQRIFIWSLKGFGAHLRIPEVVKYDLGRGKVWDNKRNSPEKSAAFL